MDLWYVPGVSMTQLISLCDEAIEREILSGHQWYFQAGEAGAADKRFLEDFGNIVRWNGPFGVRLVFYGGPAFELLTE